LTNLDTNRIAALLKPFLTDVPDLNKNCHSERSEESAVLNPAALSQAQLKNISTYIDLLLRWNARINLTAIRHPEEIVTRHFGESLFAARHLFPTQKPGVEKATPSVIDLGSGAGFPGLPIKIWAPEIDLTLIESNQKKAVFLREVTRALTLTNINIYSGRAEQYRSQSAQLVTLRAVERFASILPTAVNLLAPSGRLALLISEVQLTTAKSLTPNLTWKTPLPIPLSSSRILAVGIREP